MFSVMLHVLHILFSIFNVLHVLYILRHTLNFNKSLLKYISALQLALHVLHALHTFGLQPKSYSNLLVNGVRP
jgi:hypothetical protein